MTKVNASVATSLGQGAVQPSELPMIGIVRHEIM